MYILLSDAPSIDFIYWLFIYDRRRLKLKKSFFLLPPYSKIQFYHHFMVKFIVSFFIIMIMNILFSAEPNTLLYFCFLSPANFSVSLELLIPSFSHLLSFLVDLWLSIPSMICHITCQLCFFQKTPLFIYLWPQPLSHLPPTPFWDACVLAWPAQHSPWDLLL